MTNFCIRKESLQNLMQLSLEDNQITTLDSINVLISDYLS